MGKAQSKVVEWKPKTIHCPEHRDVKTPAWTVDDMDLLRRFIFLGTENIYSPSHVDPEKQYADLINRLIKEEKGTEVVKVIADISHSGWAPRQNYIIFALAVCARSNDIKTKQLAYEVMFQICRIPTHFFMFVNYCQLESDKSQPPSTGWGRAHRRAISKWYEKKCKNPEGIARLLTRYKSRKMVANVANEGNGQRWSHKDIFRLGHPSSADILMKVVKEFVLYGFEKAQNLASKETENDERVTKFLTYIEGTIKAKKCTDEDEMVELIKKHGLEKEHVPTTLVKKSNSVWKAIIKNMKPEAKIRSICMISAKGFCDEDSEIEKEIIETITNAVILHQARVHPIRVLSALLIYEKGEKSNGPESKPRKTEWKVNKNIVKALNTAFELSLEVIPSTKKRLLLAVDVGENMRVPCKGSKAIMCYQAVASMMMMTVRTESNCKIFGFSDSLTEIHMERKDTFSQTVAKLDSIPSGTADSALPMLWAEEKKEKIDVFIVCTDNFPADGKTNPSKALAKYRATMNKPEAKLVVVAMALNPNTIANPTKSVVIGSEKATTRDYKGINIAGFDAHAATLIAKFIKDEI